MMAFLESPRFPDDVAASSTGGPRWASQIAVGSSGYEQRNTIWSNSRHEFNAATGVKYLQDLEEIKSLFLAARGQVYGFRFKDYQDFKSCPPDDVPSATDQTIGTGDGVRVDYQLVKAYNYGFQHIRKIAKPVAGTVLVSLDDVPQGSGWSVDTATGILTFGTPPAQDVIIKSGFEFDIPVRFGADTLATQLEHYQSGQMQIPLVEIRL